MLKYYLFECPLARKLNACYKQYINTRSEYFSDNFVDRVALDMTPKTTKAIIKEFEIMLKTTIEHQGKHAKIKELEKELKNLKSKIGIE